MSTTWWADIRGNCRFVMWRKQSSNKRIATYHGQISSHVGQILKKSRMPAAGWGFSIGVRVGSSTYEAVFFIKAKVQISLCSSMAFGYGFQILLQNYLFWELRHFGVVNYADCRLVYVAVSMGQKIFGFRKKICFMINWQPLLNRWFQLFILHWVVFTIKMKARHLSL